MCFVISMDKFGFIFLYRMFSRSLIGLLSSSLTEIINTVPGWLDTVVILPDSSFRAVKYIVNTLYNIHAEDGSDNIDIEDLEETGKLLGLKLQVHEIESLEQELQIGDVTTLNESVMEESSVVEMNNADDRSIAKSVTESTDVGDKAHSSSML